jgi:hypothetical protein
METRSEALCGINPYWKVIILNYCKCPVTYISSYTSPSNGTGCQVITHSYFVFVVGVRSGLLPSEGRHRAESTSASPQEAHVRETSVGQFPENHHLSCSLIDLNSYSWTEDLYICFKYEMICALRCSSYGTNHAPESTFQSKKIMQMWTETIKRLKQLRITVLLIKISWEMYVFQYKMAMGANKVVWLRGAHIF